MFTIQFKVLRFSALLFVCLFMAPGFVSGQAFPAGDLNSPLKTGKAIHEFNASEFSKLSEDRLRTATPVEELRLPAGFRAELLYTVPLKEQGSWVCLTIDAKGRLIASAQSGGIYRITLPALEEEADAIKVEPLGIGIGNAQGLLSAFDNLYVVGSRLDATPGREDLGLYRVRDANGDDQLDDVQLLRRFEGSHDEHGPHAVVLAPDGQSLYVIGGNMCFPDRSPDRSRIATRAGVDRLAGGISAGGELWQSNRMGGWVCRLDPAGKEIELLAVGLRNAYDMAFNDAGDLLTFDSDMEWDAGMPWYRPTRVNHVISGADFGWRPDSSKWPDYFIDSFGSVVDVGFSSPTGVTFGYGSRFPAEYRNALLVGDWSMGYIYAVHLQPNGASYSGTVERFVSGAPLPVTDLVVNPHDGALYFIVGGRGVTSALYRVTYHGDEHTEPTLIDNGGRSESYRILRRNLEALHSEIGSSAVEQAWCYLSHTDRAIRYASRIAVEHQSVDLWRQRALDEMHPRRLIAAMVALARCDSATSQPDIVRALGRISWAHIAKEDAVDLVRAHVLAISRMGFPSVETRDQVLQDLTPHFPHGDPWVDHQLAEILCHLNAPEAIERTLRLLEEAPTQEEKIHYATCICTLNSGWTIDQKQRLLKWFRSSQSLRGGVGFVESLSSILATFVDRLTSQERELFADLLILQAPSDPYAELNSRRHVNDWKVSDLLPVLQRDLLQADIDRGRKLFAEAMCFRCHRFEGRGGIAGPDLTSVGRRFNAHDILEAVIDPDRIISDQYRGVTILTTDGKVVTGKINNQNGNILTVMKDAFNPADMVMIERDQIDEISPSEASLMPSGLLNTLTEDEIFDLFAFLLSAADTDRTGTETRPKSE